MGDSKFSNSADIVKEIDKLFEMYRTIRKENEDLKLMIEELKAELKNKDHELVDLKASFCRLKVARVYGWNESSKREANDKISKLVRDIDKCLEELNKLQV